MGRLTPENSAILTSGSKLLTLPWQLIVMRRRVRSKPIYSDVSSKSASFSLHLFAQVKFNVKYQLFKITFLTLYDTVFPSGNKSNFFLSVP